MQFIVALYFVHYIVYMYASFMNFTKRSNMFKKKSSCLFLVFIIPRILPKTKILSINLLSNCKIHKHLQIYTTL